MWEKIDLNFVLGNLYLPMECGNYLAFQKKPPLLTHRVDKMPW